MPSKTRAGGVRMPEGALRSGSLVVPTGTFPRICGASPDPFDPLNCSLAAYDQLADSREYRSRGAREIQILTGHLLWL